MCDMCERYKRRADRWAEIAASAREISAQRAEEVNQMKKQMEQRIISDICSCKACLIKLLLSVAKAITLKVEALRRCQN